MQRKKRSFKNKYKLCLLKINTVKHAKTGSIGFGRKFCFRQAFCFSRYIFCCMYSKIYETKSLKSAKKPALESFCSEPVQLYKYIFHRDVALFPFKSLFHFYRFRGFAFAVFTVLFIFLLPEPRSFFI